MKAAFKISTIVLLVVISTWIGLTLWAERTGPQKSWVLGPGNSSESVWIIYDPDPLYNLDEKICKAFGQALADSGIKVTIATVAVTQTLENISSDMYVFCANTYNWRPDWAITEFIDHTSINGKPVVAITVGAGSTEEAQQKLDAVIINNKGELIASKAFWLMRPNDKRRMKEPNVNVATSMAYRWAQEIVGQIRLKKYPALYPRAESKSR